MAQMQKIASFYNAGRMWDLSKFPVDFQSEDGRIITNVGVFNGYGRNGRDVSVDNDSTGGDLDKIIIRQGRDGDDDGAGQSDYRGTYMKRVSSNDKEGVYLDVPKATKTLVARIVDAADIKGTTFIAKVGNQEFDLLKARQPNGNVLVAKITFAASDVRRVRFITQRPYGEGKAGDGWAFTCVSIDC
jgi:hypothetical protein